MLIEIGQIPKLTENNVITLEKVLLLKSVTSFKETPDDILLQIVESAIKEEAFAAGELILKKGELGQAMFIIVTGRVQVHDEGIIHQELGEREIFGELAALSFGTRVSSVSALTDCLLLKISSSALYDVMNLDIGLAKGIIKALCERTRSLSEQLQARIPANKS